MVHQPTACNPATFMPIQGPTPPGHPPPADSTRLPPDRGFGLLTAVPERAAGWGCGAPRGWGGALNAGQSTAVQLPLTPGAVKARLLRHYSNAGSNELGWLISQCQFMLIS